MRWGMEDIFKKVEREHTNFNIKINVNILILYQN